MRSWEHTSAFLCDAYTGEFKCIHGTLLNNVTNWASRSVVEMAGGWGNSIMRDEASFVILEGL